MKNSTQKDMERKIREYERNVKRWLQSPKLPKRSIIIGIANILQITPEVRVAVYLVNVSPESIRALMEFIPTLQASSEYESMAEVLARIKEELIEMLNGQ
jgi:hypothetical protein